MDAASAVCGARRADCSAGQRSLNGLGPVRKWVAIGIRLAVLLLLLLIIAGVRWQTQHKDLEVMVLRDISRSTELVTDYPGKSAAGLGR